MRLLYRSRGSGAAVYAVTPEDLLRLEVEYLKKYGATKDAKEALKRDYPCFVSENAFWKVRRYRVVDVERVERAGVPLHVSLLVVMGQGSPGEDYVSLLRRLGVKPVPYRSPETARRRCFGFYAKTYEDVYRIADALAAHGAARFAVVNGVWHAQLPSRVTFRPLLQSGYFVLSTARTFKFVKLETGMRTVLVFPSGRVRILNATVPDDAERVLDITYTLIKRYNAFTGER